jgi:uncharacterized membrane protein YhaH (DUF805 family)
MGFSEAVRVCFRKYVTFSGRAKRPEYWYFILFMFLGGIIFSVFDYYLFGGTTETTATSVEVTSNGPLTSIFNLAVLLPSLAVGWRRMHDTGRSGLYLFFPLIVMICVGAYLAIWGGLAQLLNGNIGAFFGGLGGIVGMVALALLILSPLIVFIWLLQPSQPGDNDYGPAT